MRNALLIPEISNHARQKNKEQFLLFPTLFTKGFLHSDYRFFTGILRIYCRNTVFTTARMNDSPAMTLINADYR